MFIKQKSYVRLDSIDEIFDVSYCTEETDRPFSRGQNNGVIAFANKSGRVYITPYRPEINGILMEAGYEDVIGSVPFSGGGEQPDEYLEFKKLAEEQNLAYICEKAYKIANKRGIQPCEIINCKATEVDSWLIDKERNLIYYRMLDDTFYSEDNIGTYIVVDAEALLLCDEYGRTYFVQVYDGIDDAITTLNEAGYSSPKNKEFYVQEKKPEAE